MKPLIRWTIGSCEDLGYDVLKHSVNLMRRMYEDRVDYIVSYNRPVQMDKLYELDIELYEQDKDCLPIVAKDVAWKLYPPRLRPESHELHIDNDLVLFNKLPEIEEFFKQEDLFLYSEGMYGLYGNFRNMVPENFILNSGFIGLPPGIDYEYEVLRFLPDYWDDRFDEQGLVATIISRQKNLKIGLEKISICEDSFIEASHGYHFVKCNRGMSKALQKFWLKKAF